MPVATERLRRRDRHDRSILTAVWLGVTTAVLLFSALTLVTSLGWFGTRERPPDLAPFAVVSSSVDLWVGDLAPGVKGVLASDWCQPDWNARSDERVSEALGLKGGDALAFATLVLANTSRESATVPTGAGSLVLKSAEGAVVSSVSLAPLLGPAADPAVAATLRFMGAGRDSIDVPAGRMVRVPVAFPRRVCFEKAAAVERGDGTPFRRRRMAQREWAGLLESPSLDLLRDL